MSPPGPDELRAVHAARRELGPDYDDALLDSFVDRAEAQLRRRLEADRPVARRGPAPTREPVQVTLGPGGLTLVLVNSAWGVVSSLILAVAADMGPFVVPLFLVWMVLGLADATYLGALVARRVDERRKRKANTRPAGATRRPAHGQRPRGSTT